MTIVDIVFCATIITVAVTTAVYSWAYRAGWSKGWDEGWQEAYGDTSTASLEFTREQWSDLVWHILMCPNCSPEHREVAE